MHHIAALALALVVACSSAPAPTRCTPGASVACVCPGVGTGAQVCAADGSSYGACACGADVGGSDAAAEDRPAGIDVVAVDRPDVRMGTDVVDASMPADVDPRCVANGAASTWCPSGAGACVDLQRDPANCGACGRRCNAPLTECFGGQCFIPADADAGADAGGTADVRDVPTFDVPSCTRQQTACGPLPTDCVTLAVGAVTIPPTHCGACGVTCAVGEGCIGGRCLNPCPSGQLMCDPGAFPVLTGCVDISVGQSSGGTVRHCGGCSGAGGHACVRPLRCAEGRCQP